MAYLTSAEIASYTNLPGITEADIANASLIIDSYKLMSFNSKEYTEKVTLKKKNARYGEEYKGKLLHIPRCEILEIYANVRSYFGGTVKQSYDPSCLEFDSDELWYFTFYPEQISNVNPFPTIPPTHLYVRYRAGYDQIPEALKRATGILADNIRKNGGFQKWQSRTDFDMTIQLVKNEGLLTSEIKQLIDLVQLT